MLSCRVVLPLPRRARIAALVGAILPFAALPLSAASPQVTHFCAACGFHGVESFMSQGGQFIVHGSRVPFRPPPERTNNPAIIELEPQVVVVTAERTKRAFCQALAIPDDFHDKVHLSVLDRAPLSQPVAVVSQVHP